MELVEAELSLVVSTELALVLAGFGLVELVEAELSLVVSTELVLVLAGFGLVELVEAELSLVTMVSPSTTVAFNPVPSTPSLTSVCSTSTSVVGVAVSRKVESPSPGAGDGEGVTVPRRVVSPSPGASDGEGVTVSRKVESPGAGAGDVAGVTVSRKVESPGAGAGDVAGVTVPRRVVSPSPGALLSTCFFLGNTKVPSNCKRALDNLDWSKYEPEKWTLAMTMRMTAFISATC